MKGKEYPIFSNASFIDTLLQRGADDGVCAVNRFSGFHFGGVTPASRETAKAVELCRISLCTPLKRGVNNSEIRGFLQVPGSLHE
jgi:hypothetical protein